MFLTVIFPLHFFPDGGVWFSPSIHIYDTILLMQYEEYYFLATYNL